MMSAAVLSAADGSLPPLNDAGEWECPIKAVEASSDVADRLMALVLKDGSRVQIKE